MDKEERLVDQLRTMNTLDEEQETEMVRRETNFQIALEKIGKTTAELQMKTKFLEDTKTLLIESSVREQKLLNELDELLNEKRKKEEELQAEILSLKQEGEQQKKELREYDALVQAETNLSSKMKTLITESTTEEDVLMSEIEQHISKISILETITQNNSAMTECEMVDYNARMKQDFQQLRSALEKLKKEKETLQCAVNGISVMDTREKSIPDGKQAQDKTDQKTADQEPHFTASIDFGTSYCSWSLGKSDSFENTDPASPIVVSKKVPTSALIKPDGKTLKAFGDDAERYYKELAAKGQHRDYYYFLRFKLALDTETIARDIMIEDIMGKTLPAKNVFALSFEYISNEILQMGKDNGREDVTVKDFHWALSVPAVWSDAAKQFMRLAAEEANIRPEDLSIGYDTEAAALFCQNIEEKDKNFKPGARYMILDAGGGKVQLSVHEVGSSGELMEITATTGHSVGGHQVNKAFEGVLVDVFGEDIYTAFKKDKTSDWMQLWQEFEERKKPFDPSTISVVEINIPSTLISQTKSELQQLIDKSKYSNAGLAASGSVLKIGNELMTVLFHKPLWETVELVRSSLQLVNGVTTIYMVGGFSASRSLQQAIKREFPDLIIVNPKGEAVIAGTLIGRSNPKAITQRVLKKTYGVEICTAFKVGEHPENKRKVIDGKKYCENVFSKHVEKGQTISVGERQKERDYVPLYDKQEAITFKLYSSDEKDPKYTDEGCTEMGKLTIDISDVPGNLDRRVLVSMTFSETEITATARAEKTGKSVTAKCDFLG